jgi:hypothetical protein
MEGFGSLYCFVGEEGYGRDVGRGLDRKIFIFAVKKVYGSRRNQ